MWFLISQKPYKTRRIGLLKTLVRKNRFMEKSLCIYTELLDLNFKGKLGSDR